MSSSQRKLGRIFFWDECEGLEIEFTGFSEDPRQVCFMCLQGVGGSHRMPGFRLVWKLTRRPWEHVSEETSMCNSHTSATRWLFREGMAKVTQRPSSLTVAAFILWKVSTSVSTHWCSKGAPHTYTGLCMYHCGHSPSFIIIFIAYFQSRICFSSFLQMFIEPWSQRLYHFSAC